MNPVLAKVLKKGAQEAVKKAIKYIKDDQQKTYALDEVVSFEIEAKGMGNKPAFKTKDGSLEYTPIDSDHFRVTCYPFPAEAHLWNGPDIIKDDNLAAMAASLVHDLWWIHATEISEAWKCDRIFTLHYGNELLNCIWLLFEPRSRTARIAFGICEWASPWYHKVKKLVGLGCLAALLATGAGCGLLNAPGDWRVVSAEGTNAIVRAMQSSSAEAGAVLPGGGLSSLSSLGTSAGDLSAYPLGLASCWGGANASERMMNVLSPKMDDATFRARLDFMVSRGCTAAHLILANGGDGECAGYAAWRESDRPAMLARLKAVKAAGLKPVPWIITDDSAALQKELFADADALVAAMTEFFDGAPYVVLGLEMDEGGATAGDWTRVRDALRKVYDGPIGTHHCSGNDFPFASLGDIVLGQLEPGCTEAQVKSQISAIKSKGKRAVGFEYSRSPNRKLSLAALGAGAEGVGNWDGGGLPSTSEKEGGAAGLSDDEVDFGTLDWCYGGFRGGGATPADGCRIKDLKVGGGKMSYAWQEGDCKPLGEAKYGDAKCLACLFCLGADGHWRGGKFEWVGTSRTSRSLGNCDGYGGWKMSDVENATQYAFVIVSEDGRKRSNVITCGR